MSFLSAISDVFSRGNKLEEKKEKDRLSAYLYSLLLERVDLKDYENQSILSKYSVEVHNITIACTVLSQARSVNQLIDITGSEIERYPLKALTVFLNELSEKAEAFDEVYKNKLLKKYREQLFDTHHKIMILKEKRKYSDYLSSPGKKSDDYWLMVLEACKKKACYEDPYSLYLHYLLAGFRMFALKEPGHVIGMPFPDGEVEKRGAGVFYCPAKDKGEKYQYSICSFCPAKIAESLLKKNQEKDSD